MGAPIQIMEKASSLILKYSQTYFAAAEHSTCSQTQVAVLFRCKEFFKFREAFWGLLERL